MKQPEKYRVWYLPFKALLNLIWLCLTCIWSQDSRERICKFYDDLLEDIDAATAYNQEIKVKTK